MIVKRLKYFLISSSISYKFVLASVAVSVEGSVFIYFYRTIKRTGCQEEIILCYNCSMVTDNAAFYRHNIRIYYIFEAIRALVFAVAVWVLYQRQYISASQYVFIEGLILGIQLLMELPTGAFADLVS